MGSLPGRPTGADYRTDYVLRGVRVPPGEHVVEFVFRPMSLVYGLVGTGMSCLGLLILVLWRRWPRLGIRKGKG